MKHELIKQLQYQNFRSEQEFYEYLISIGYPPGSFYSEIEMSDDYIEVHPDRSTRSTGLHSHDYYEILCIVDANIDYLIGSERFSLQTGDIIMVPPGVSHQPLFRNHSLYDRYVLSLSRKFCDSVAAVDPWMNTIMEQYRVLRPDHGTYYINQFKKLTELSDSEDEGKQIRLYGRTIELIGSLKQLFQSPVFHSQKNELFDQINEYIEMNYRNGITLTEAADHFYISESSLSHLFKEETGFSFHQAVNARKLIEAKNLLAQGVRPTDIWAMVGYGDYSSFYRAFQRRFGISPKEYIRRFGK